MHSSHGSDQVLSRNLGQPCEPGSAMRTRVSHANQGRPCEPGSAMRTRVTWLPPMTTIVTMDEVIEDYES